MPVDTAGDESVAKDSPDPPVKDEALLDEEWLAEGKDQGEEEEPPLTAKELAEAREEHAQWEDREYGRRSQGRTMFLRSAWFGLSWSRPYVCQGRVRRVQCASPSQ